MSALFVTGSGTGVGKTHVLCSLAAELCARGAPPRVLKPLVTGFDPERPEESDTGKLLAAVGMPLDEAALDAVSPWRFRAPLSPDRAAARERRGVELAELVEVCRRNAREATTLIEGIGGVMVPIDAEHTVLDWIAALGVPALLVTGSYLGALSHALTASLALRSRNVTLAAVLVSESADPALPLPEHRDTLARFVPGVPVLTWARDAPRPEPTLLDVLGGVLGV